MADHSSDRLDHQSGVAPLLAELKRTLDSLSNNVSANTKMMKTLKKAFKKDEDEENITPAEREDRVSRINHGHILFSTEFQF